MTDLKGRTLKGRALENLKKFLDADAEDFNADAPRGRDPYNHILGWANDPEYGGLPSYSARPFANWLSNEWANWTEEPITVKEVLEGAVVHWCGGRTMPS